MTIMPSHIPRETHAPRSNEVRPAAQGLGARQSVRVICAWCKGDIHSRESKPLPYGVSHGICRPCASEYFGIDLPGVA